MDFGKALHHLKEGRKVTRTGWYGKHYIKLHDPLVDEPSTQWYILIYTQSGDIIPWLASQTDVLAEDWLVETSAT